MLHDTFCVLVRFLDDDLVTIRQWVIAFTFLGAPINGHTLAAFLIDVIADYFVPRYLVINWMHDRCSVNVKAQETLAVLYTNATDAPCQPHTMNNVRTLVVFWCTFTQEFRTLTPCMTHRAHKRCRSKR